MRERCSTRRPGQSRISAPLVATLLVSLAASSCASSHRGSAPRSRATDLLSLHGSPPNAAGEPAAEALAGRVILIDPGHGGPFDGVVGEGGLREADVNLRVAFELQRLLNEAGARAILTRATDRAVAGDGASLGRDLSQRATLANDLQADLFLSLHHNSSLPLDRNRTAAQVYFRLSDDGPSLDAARALYRELLLGLGLPPGGLTAANYRVLRESRVPSVLCEATYLSNPEVESRLRGFDAIQAEAQAYFRGLTAYFARGVPRLRLVDPGVPVPDDSRPVLGFAMDDPGGGGIDPLSVSLRLDGETVANPVPDGRGILWFTPDSDLVSGRHVIELRARNRAGNAAPAFRHGFEVRLAPARMEARSEPVRLAASGNPAARITAAVLDRAGNPVADGTRVAAEATNGELREESAATKGGVAVFHLEAPAGGDPVEVGLEVAPSSPARARLVLPRGGGPLAWGRVVSTADGSAIEGARVTLARPAGKGENPREGGIVRTDASGWFYLELPQPGPTGADPERAPAPSPVLTVLAPGYRRVEQGLALPGAGSALHRDVPLPPVAAGALHHLCIAIDPAGGGEETGVVSAGGTAAKDFALAAAREFAALLAAAGATPVLTRSGDVSRSGTERVGAAEDAGARMLVRLSAPPAPSPGRLATVYHYPGSAAGSAAADSIAAVLRELLGDPVAVEESATFVLQQVSAPAVEVALHGLEGTGRLEREIAAGPEATRRIAFALYQGMLAVWAGAPDSAGEIELQWPRDEGPPRAQPALLLDGVLPLPHPRGERMRLRRVAPGEHEIEAIGTVRHPGERARFVVSRGGVTPFLLPEELTRAPRQRAGENMD